MFLRLLGRRLFSAESTKVTESLLKQKLTRGFPNASDIQIQDISGGCGAMFEVYIESPEFKDISRVKQHQMVNTVLAEEVKIMHGIRISTSATKEIKT